MERLAYHQIAAVEDTHWWSVYRRRLVAQLIEDAGGVRGEAALDIGCGSGGNLPFLKNYAAAVSGLDLSEDAIALACKKFPNGDFHRGNINELSTLYAAESFDLIADFNVLYHSWIKSDIQSLREIHRLLRPRGVFISTEPAFTFLRRASDVLDHGVRRYTLSQWTRMLKEAGYADVRGTYFNLPSFPIALLSAGIHCFGSASLDRAGASELKLPPKWLNEAVSTVLGLELCAIKAFGRIPIGVSIACIARKGRV